MNVLGRTFLNSRKDRRKARWKDVKTLIRKDEKMKRRKDGVFL